MNNTEFACLFTVLTLCITCISNEGVPRPVSGCDRTTNPKGTTADREGNDGFGVTFRLWDA